MKTETLSDIKVIYNYKMVVKESVIGCWINRCCIISSW